MDSLLNEQATMAENDPTFLSSTNVPPTSDLQLAPVTTDGPVSTQPPEVVLPERTLVQQPRWPHPNFGWSLLWCVFFVIMTQVPGAFFVALVLVGLLVFSPDMMKSVNDPADLLKLPIVNAAYAVAFFINVSLVIGFSWLIIRLVVGKDWMRQLAVRRPSLAHTLLALVSLPVLALGGELSYKLLRDSGQVPSISHANPLNLVYFWIAVFVVLGAVLLGARLLAGSGWTRRLASRPTRPADILITAAALPFVVLGILLIYQGLRRAFPASGLESVKLAGMEEMENIIGNWPLGLAVLVIGLGPGIGEELWCRGFLGRGLVGSHGAVLGVLASAFCFGFIHGDPCQGVMAMIMGLWLHFVYLTSRSLLLPMLLHFLNNSLSVVAESLPQLKQVELKPQDTPLSVYLTALLLLGGVAYGLYQSRARLAGKSPEQPLVWRPPFEGVEYPPAESGMRVVHPSLSFPAAALAFGAFLVFVLALTAWIQQVMHYGG